MCVLTSAGTWDTCTETHPAGKHLNHYKNQVRLRAQTPETAKQIRVHSRLPKNATRLVRCHLSQNTVPTPGLLVVFKNSVIEQASGIKSLEREDCFSQF